MNGDGHNKPERPGKPEDDPLDLDLTVPKHKPAPSHTPTPPPRKPEPSQTPPSTGDLDFDVTMPPKRKPDAAHTPPPAPREEHPAPPASGESLDSDVTMPKRRPEPPRAPTPPKPEPSRAPAGSGADLDSDITMPPKRKADVTPAPAPREERPAPSADDEGLASDVTMPKRRPESTPAPAPPKTPPAAPSNPTVPPRKPEPTPAPAAAEANLDLDVTAPPKRSSATVPHAPPVGPSGATKPYTPPPAAKPLPSSNPTVPPRKPEPSPAPASAAPDLDVTMPPKKPAAPVDDLDTDITIRPKKPTDATPAPLDDDATRSTTPPAKSSESGPSPLDKELDEPAPASSVPGGLTGGRSVGGGRFTLTRELGRGGMGVVWLAYDVRLKRDVALKLLPPEVAADEMALNDLRRETIESQRLSHPHIMRIHDLYETAGEPAFISMEYVDGPNLRSLLDKQSHRVLKWEFLRPLMLQLCEALDYAHEERVIHRDLKPANLMLDSKGRLKLADFGIAATMSDSMSRISNKDKDTSGTLIYMSPQQMRGDSPRAADDLYALGAAWYELLTSKTPFYRDDIAEQVRNDIPPAPAQRLKEFGLVNPIPEGISSLIMSCLAKDPKQRPVSAKWIMEQIQASAPARPAPAANVPENRSGGSKPPPPSRPGPGVTPGRGDAPRSPALLRTVTPPPAEPGLLDMLKTKLGMGIVAGIVILLIFILAMILHHKSPKAIVPAPGKTGTQSTSQNSGTGTSTGGATKPAPAPLARENSGPITITLQTPGAVLYTNGTMLRSTTYPLHLKGTVGERFNLEARLDDYITFSKVLTFPAANQETSVAIVLAPKPVRVTVQSDPPAASVTFNNAQQTLVSTTAKDGVELRPGLTYQVIISNRDYLTLTTNLPALRPGQAVTLNVGALRLKAGILHLKADPADAIYTLLIPGAAPSALGAGNAVDNLPAKVAFQIIASKPGYISKTNDFNLERGESNYDFGRLKVAPGALHVKVDPDDANIVIYYSSRDKESFGTNRNLDGSIRPGVPFSVVAERKNYVSQTNVYAQGIAPGEVKQFDFGKLKPLDGSLRLKADPSDSTYTIIFQGKEPASIGSRRNVGVTALLPFQIVAEHKGYVSQTNTFTLQPGEPRDCDFGHLKPLPASLRIKVEPEDAVITIVFGGKDTKSYGTAKTIEGLPPGVKLRVLAERDGYLPANNRVTLDPGETHDINFGKLKARN